MIKYINILLIWLTWTILTVWGEVHYKLIKLFIWRLHLDIQFFLYSLSFETGR
jgi:hypothetical protein